MMLFYTIISEFLNKKVVHSLVCIFHFHLIYIFHFFTQNITENTFAYFTQFFLYIGGNSRPKLIPAFGHFLDNFFPESLFYQNQCKYAINIGGCSNQR